ncbi:MAG: Coenzyme F420 hydrogenase/dehydrogenase, beta subunit C-terminal domain [Candidatus Aureabacteria bacterium]|nr:Coenzyme F420 hydrogenase/dehydrogenase, beta subunit C-terminal domain [Candidatus Auribacterota bacterium]
MQQNKKSINCIEEIVAQRLCHRCGSCAGICPKGVIGLDDDYYPRGEKGVGECTDCGLCVRVCPGISFSFPGFSRRIFGREVRAEDTRGIFLKAFLAYSADPAIRRNSTSGGISTRLPLWMLETGRVSGAFTVISDPGHPWKPRAVIARKPEEILRGAYSKYPACSMNHLFSEIRNERGPFVFTGIPCQVHGLRKMEETNKSIGDRIALVIGLFCHSCLEHQAIKDMMSIYRIDERMLGEVCYRFGKLPGYVRAVTRSGQEVYLPYPQLPPGKYRPNAKEVLTFFFKFYSPPRCRMCIDALSEFADISVGDAWIKGWQASDRLREGHNLVIARTERGLKMLEEARDAGAIVLDPFDRELMMTSHEPMATMKRLRAFHNIARAKRRGRPHPDYGFEKSFTMQERTRAAMNAATYFAADIPRLRRFLFYILLSRPGRYLIGFSFFRRRVVVALMEKLKLKMK